MQISKPIISPDLQSFMTPAVEGSAVVQAPGTLTKVANAVRYVFDIDDGAGGVTCMLCVLAIFGTLFFRLAQLDNALESQSLTCSQVSRTSLQLECKFE